MKTVAAGYIVAFYRQFFFFVNESNRRLVCVDILNTDVTRFETKRLIVTQSSRNEVLDDFMLRIIPY